MLLGQQKLVSFFKHQPALQRAPCYQLSLFSSTAAARGVTTAAAVAAPVSPASSPQVWSRLYPQRSLTTSACTSSAIGLLLPPLPSSMGSVEAEPLSLDDTLQAVAIPPSGRNLGPRVEHIQVAATGQLSDAVAGALQLPQWFVLELMRFGAVHYCPVMPPPSPKVGQT